MPIAGVWACGGGAGAAAGAGVAAGWSERPHATTPQRSSTAAAITREVMTPPSTFCVINHVAGGTHGTRERHDCTSFSAGALRAVFDDRRRGFRGGRRPDGAGVPRPGPPPTWLPRGRR